MYYLGNGYSNWDWETQYEELGIERNISYGPLTIDFPNYCDTDKAVMEYFKILADYAMNEYRRTEHGNMLEFSRRMHRAATGF